MTHLTTAQAADELGTTPAVLRSAAARAIRSGATPASIGQTPASDGRSASWDLDITRAWWSQRRRPWCRVGCGRRARAAAEDA